MTYHERNRASFEQRDFFEILFVFLGLYTLWSWGHRSPVLSASITYIYVACLLEKQQHGKSSCHTRFFRRIDNTTEGAVPVYYAPHSSLESPMRGTPLGYRYEVCFQGSDCRVERRYDGFSMYRLPALKSFKLRLQRMMNFNEQSKPWSAP